MAISLLATGLILVQRILTAHGDLQGFAPQYSLGYIKAKAAVAADMPP